MARRRRVHRGRRKKRGFKTWSLGRKIGTILGGTLLTVVVAGVAAGAFFIANKVEKLDTKELDTEALAISQEVEHKEGYLNVALFGVDTRADGSVEGDRSDTIMVASLDQGTGEVKICSVYRDTLLQLSDGSYNKANAAYSFGGVEEAVALLNRNLDLDIQHYVTVDFIALIDVIDALGGVELELTEEEAEWTNAYAADTAKVSGKEVTATAVPGLQTLDGVLATGYCRIRYTAGDDYKRTERQRAVIEQIVKKAQQANLATINQIIDSVFEKIETNFTLTEILSYAKDFMDYQLTETAGFPFDKTTATLSGIGSSVIPVTLESNVTQLHQFLFGEDGYVPSSVIYSISAGIVSKSGDVEADTQEETENYVAPEEDLYTDTTGNGYNYYDDYGGQTDSGAGDWNGGTTGAGGGTTGDTGGGAAGGTGSETTGDTGGGTTGDTGGETTGDTGGGTAGDAGNGTVGNAGVQ